MQLRIVDFRDALAIINSTDARGEITYPILYKRYYEFIEMLESITDEEIIAEFNREKALENPNKKNKLKSLSPAINKLIKSKMEELDGWESESFLFNEDEYRKTKTRGDSDHTEWRLDFASEDAIAVEVAFNHGEAIAWNLNKLQISAELNHVEKAINTRIGVYVCATSDMKKVGNFDPASGSFEKVQRFFKPMRNQLTAPIVLIGLEAPTSFHIDDETRQVVAGPYDGSSNVQEEEEEED